MAACRTTTPAHPSAIERLTAIAWIVEEAVAFAPGGTLVRVVADERDVELGLQALDPGLHPCLELRGYVAPPEWWAVGLVVPGRAWFLDEPGRAPEPITSTFFVERGGAEISLLRRGEQVTEGPGPVVGRVPDLCRSMLGLPAGTGRTGS